MPIQEKAKRLYDQAIVIDGLNVSNWDSPNVYTNLRAGNLTAICATIAVWENFQQAMAQAGIWLRRFRERSDILQVKTTQDIRVAKETGKTGIILSFQNASPIENELDRLGIFHALGVRMIQLTYHERNLLGNGCLERHDEGLSNFGLDAVREMNHLGILIDLSHVGDRTSIEAIEASEKPVAISHANARAYHDHPRNKTDEVLKLLAQKGGVVGASSFCNFLPSHFDSTIEDFVNAIEDMIERVGIDHVAVGTDTTQDQPLSFWHYVNSQQGTKYPGSFSNTSFWGRFKGSPARVLRYEELPFQPKGMEGPAEFPNLAEALLTRGYSADETNKILGQNWLRIFREVWQS